MLERRPVKALPTKAGEKVKSWLRMAKEDKGEVKRELSRAVKPGKRGSRWASRTG